MKVPNFIQRWIRRQAVEAVAEALEKNQAPLAPEIRRHVVSRVAASTLARGDGTEGRMR